MVIRKSQLIRLIVKLASLPLRCPGAALLPEQSEAYRFIWHWFVRTMLCNYYLQHLLWSFSCLLVSEWPRTHFNAYVKEEKGKKIYRYIYIYIYTDTHTCNFPSDTKIFIWSLPGSFLDRNHIYSDWTRSSDSVCSHNFSQSRHIYYGVMKQMMSPHFSAFPTARSPEATDSGKDLHKETSRRNYTQGFQNLWEIPTAKFFSINPHCNHFTTTLAPCKLGLRRSSGCCKAFLLLKMSYKMGHLPFPVLAFLTGKGMPLG